MNVEYEYQCGNCIESEETNDSWRIYCKYYKAYYDKSDSCNHQKRKQKGEDGVAGCFITTIVCDILGYDDKSNILETLRGFRKNVMQKSLEYKEVLYEYDVAGPQIAHAIKEDNDLELINGMLDFYILPTVNLIRDKKYNEAVARYKNMTKALENYYGIPFEEKAPVDYDYTCGGHGVKKIGEYNGKERFFEKK